MRKARHKISPYKSWIFLWAIINAVTVRGLKLVDGKDPHVKYTSLDYGDVNLKLDENIENVTLLKIKDAKGDVKFRYPRKDETCITFSDGISLKLTSEGSLTLSLSKSLDYEEKYCQTISLWISDSAEEKTMFLDVNNLDDNPPIFVPPILQCIINENTKYTKDNTTCHLKMTDRDGMMENTKFPFSTEENDVQKKFNVAFGKTPKKEDKEAEVIVYLLDGITLDYESLNFYTFSINATEQVEFNDFDIVIKVGDMPDQAPTWTHMITNEKFEENVNQVFQVKAIDGDTGINNPIYYEKIGDVCEKKKCKIDIGKEDGIITVADVDREIVGDTIKFTIQAIEDDGTDHGNRTTLDITFFIEDQDDNSPVITAEEENGVILVSVDENYKDVITTFSVQDLDLAASGTFTIKMDIEKGSVNYTKAFNVIPVSGYQNGEFTLSVFNSTKLDYEDDDWKIIEFQIFAIEEADPSHTDKKTVRINLNDLNDEPPVFVNTSTEAYIWESICKGEEIFNAIAIDRDYGDLVSYEIIGIWSNTLSISNEGIITPKKDKVFDYEQLQQVFLQILATDTDEVHKTYKTLTINVMDVDDESPSIRVGKNRVTVKENTPSGFKITDAEITATDPDTKPKLKLEIDWSTSTITKNSALVTTEKPWQCFAIETQPHEDEAREIRGILSISGCVPNFELYDTIVIGLTVTDFNTDKRYLKNRSSSGSITINIEDENDEPPVFLPSSLVGMEVTDAVQGPQRIGIISAHDPDIDDKITFSVVSLDPEIDWVEIDEDTGELKIKEKVTINDDIPIRYNISLKIIACDKNETHCPPAEVNISIKDVNNQKPKILAEQNIIEIDEKSGDDVWIMFADHKDCDRDEPFHTVVFRFDTNILDESANRFSISEEGNITVRLRYGSTLDRDYGSDTYILPLLAYDNPKGTSQLTDRLDVTVKLRDINDHTPEVINKTLNSVENWKKGMVIGQIMAEDPDEGLNATTIFEILKVEPISAQNLNLDKSFFKVESVGDKTANVSLLRDLKGFYGTFNITIKTSDKGTPPNMRDNNSIILTVEKYNFERPKFIYPPDNEEIVLSMDQIIRSSGPLKLFDGGELHDLEVDDLQNHKFDVNFAVIEENGKPPSLFTIQNFAWTARLQLLRNLNDNDLKTQKIIIEAKLNTEHQDGEATTSVQTHMNIKFFSTSEQPTFHQKTFFATFDEKNLQGYQNIPSASFSIPNVSPYYFLLTNEVANIFEVNTNNGTITLLEELDCGKQSSYVFEIQASTKDRDRSPSSESILEVTVEVYDVNDHEPQFHPSGKINAACLKTYTKQSTIITIKATDEDPRDDGNLNFSLGKFTCTENLSPSDPPFVIGSKDGKIAPTFTVSSDMSGYCIADVTVTDNKDKYGNINHVNTSVQINIIGDDELIGFIFMNTDSEVDNKLNEITTKIDQILEKLKLRSHLSDRSYDAEWKNTSAHFYFLNEDTQAPVEAAEVFGNLTDPDNFGNLKKSLRGVGIFLDNFPSENTEQTTSNQLLMWSFVLLCVQTSLLLITFIAFFFRNKALKRRIQNLSTTKFGSQDSGLNRAGIAAPNTNKNAIEGSNPVFNSENYVKEIEPQADTESINSGDSVLFGVENNPEFDI